LNLYVIIAYDTPSDSRRNKLAKTLKGFGQRKQYSLFEARVTQRQWRELKARIAAIVDSDEDRLAAYFLAPEAIERTWRIGNRGIEESEGYEIM
jgi:CRISPR-associated protein Cas2